jgi:hypothetical protein
MKHRRKDLKLRTLYLNPFVHYKSEKASHRTEDMVNTYISEK